jgi:hypothetical protein
MNKSIQTLHSNMRHTVRHTVNYLLFTKPWEDVIEGINRPIWDTRVESLIKEELKNAN